MNLQPTLSVSVKHWLHSDMHIWAHFLWIQRTLRVQAWEPSGTLVKEQDSLELISDYGA
jgi:hypothetical protein